MINSKTANGERAAGGAGTGVTLKKSVADATDAAASAPAATARAAARARAAADAEAAKPKPKLVRDSFTIPKSEYAVLDALKLRAARLMRPTKKSEVLRAGIAALDAMSDKAFLSAINGVPSLKTGRPKSVPVAAAAKKTTTAK